MFIQAAEKLKFSAVLRQIRRYARSPLGLEKIDASEPVDDILSVRRNLDLLDEMKSVIENEDPMPMEGIRDVREIVQRSSIEGNVLPGKDIRSVYATATASHNLKTYFRNRSQRCPRLAELSASLLSDKVLEHHIDTILNEEGGVRDTASNELQNIRRSIRRTSETLRRRLEKILKSLAADKMTQEELITTREGRMVVPVKSEHKHHVPGFIHSSSASGATVFIEPAETLEINNELREYQIMEQREIERLLRILTAKIAEKRNDLSLALEILAELDFLFAKAHYSIEILGCRPVESRGRIIRLDEARHPLLLLHHNRNSVVPLYLTLGDTFRTLIITGPNAGGKSVAMQTVGLLCLMYQAGLHIPASPGTELPVMRSIFVSIGDEQSIEHDLSTFSSHLLAIKGITESAGEDSLVLIDEIGSGTDPVEGSAIAASVLEYLTRNQALTIATTHHGDLKAFAFEQPDIENGAMEFDQNTLEPTYRFTAGIPGSSYALEIAQRMQFSSELLQRARSYLGSGRQNLERLLVNLEQQIQEYKQKHEAVSSEKTRLDALTGEYESKLGGLKQEIRQLKQAAALEAAQIVERANAVIENAVREIRETQAQPDVSRRWKEEIQNMRQDIEKELHSETGTPASDMSPLMKGDHVRLTDGGQVGEVLETEDDTGFVHVLFGSIKLRVSRDKLLKTKEKIRVSSTTNLGVSEEERQTISRTLDVRGYTGDEAVAALEYFLDRALLAGFETVEIIHGKGSGVLRNKITEQLKKNAHITGMRLGNWNEGSSGVTIAELRK